MDPFETGLKYDKLALWWQQYHLDSNYGVFQLERALQFTQSGGHALDIGCGCGGRFINLLDRHAYSVTGIDVSKDMIRLAKSNHIDHIFLHADICEFDENHSYDFILAWDSIFHLPLAQQAKVLKKMCSMLTENGVLLYTCGNAQGASESTWQNDTFYYSSIGIKENLRILLENDIVPLHVELDQFPERHVCIIAQKQ